MQEVVIPVKIKFTNEQIKKVKNIAHKMSKEYLWHDEELEKEIWGARPEWDWLELFRGTIESIPGIRETIIEKIEESTGFKG